MADERDFSVIKPGDFEEALRVYFANLEEQYKRETGIFPIRDISSELDRQFDEIMQATVQYGINPNAGQ